MVTMPLSWYLTREYHLGIIGLWTGYGAFSAIQIVLNYFILFFVVDWQNAGRQQEDHNYKQLSPSSKSTKTAHYSPSLYRYQACF